MSRTFKPEYANWVSLKLVAIPGVAGLALGALVVVSLWCALPGVLLLACAVYFAYARYQFSSRGGGIQARVRALLLDRLEWDGVERVLDIGCGNGPVAIDIALARPGVRVTGVDVWGASWEYSRTVCERNAGLAGVANAVTFEKASAAALPFADETFDMVVSNLVFHDIRRVRDKYLLIREALRVLRRGGVFVFQDLFLWESAFGKSNVLVSRLSDSGVQTVDLIPTNRADFIPRALKLPFMLGTLAILKGRK